MTIIQQFIKGFTIGFRQQSSCNITYEENIAGGAFILVDEATYNTVAAGMIL